MNIDRRHLAIVGALAIGTAGVLRDSIAAAASADEAAVKDAVEALRQAIFAADKAKLTAVAADQLSYGHSDARVQNKAEFVDGVVTRKATVKTLEFPDLTIAVSGDAAVARHLYVSQSELDGKTTDVKIGAIEFWQNQGGSWKLLGRQGFKLA
jgi:ketosteroid isomerase-like protein